MADTLAWKELVFISCNVKGCVLPYNVRPVALLLIHVNIIGFVDLLLRVPPWWHTSNISLL